MTRRVELQARGFAVVDRVVGPGDISSIMQALGSRPRPSGRGGSRHLLAVPCISALAFDARVRGLAAEALGAPAIPFRATLFDKSPSTNWLVAWHQDTILPLRGRLSVPGWGRWSVKEGVAHAQAPASVLGRIVAVRVHLDDSTESNGPLRVLPGSHSRGVLDQSGVREVVAAVAPVTCCVPRGGAVVIRPLVVHASSKCAAAASRRVLHLEYAESLAVDRGLELAVA